MALNIDLNIGETIQIGSASITLSKKSGRCARLSIDADRSIEVSFVKSNPRKSEDFSESKRMSATNTGVRTHGSHDYRVKRP